MTGIFSIFVAGAGLAWSGGGAAAAPLGQAASSQPEKQAAPMDVAGELDSTWEYLRRKYDADGDGRVTTDEYQRDGGQFDRLDRNEDGVITEDDFARGAGGQMRGMMTQAVVLLYFQDDDQPSQLSLEEMKRAAKVYDTSKDGLVDQEEFTCLAENRKASTDDDMMRRMSRRVSDGDPWEMLLAGADTDKDGKVSEEELVAYFESRDDGDGVWSMGGRGGRGAGRGNRGGRGDRPMTGPAVGTVAPDFQLQPPEGGETVILSGFRAKQPVALIFGSYT
jgi:Ca2+-binding EF-hand superfamily protein